MLRRWLAGAMFTPVVHLSKPPPSTPVEPGSNSPAIKLAGEVKTDHATLIHATTSDQPAATSTTQTTTTVGTPHDTTHQYANLLDDECPWCIAMRSGPCGKQFATWQRCVKDIRATQEARLASSLSSFSLTTAERHKRDEAEYQRECMDYFRRLHTCIHKNAQSRRYYGELVRLKRDEEEREELGEEDDGWPDDDD